MIAQLRHGKIVQAYGMGEDSEGSVVIAFDSCEARALGGDAQAVRRVWRGAPEEPRSGVQTRSQARAATQAQAHEAEQGRGRGAGRGGRR